MGAFKGDYLDLLPQEKEVCIKLIGKWGEIKSLTFDTGGLYLSESYIKKGWRMFINKARGEVYILTGSAKLKIYHVCGNVKVLKNGKEEIGSFYIRVPYLCTSRLFCEAPRLSVRASFKESKVYRSQGEKDAYVVGTVKISKADT